MAVGTYALCSYNDVKSYGGKTGITDADKTLVEDLIDMKTAEMETYIEREVMSRERTEYLDGKGARQLYTEQYPITTVSGIWDDFEWTWGSDTLVASADYRIHEDGRSVVRKLSAARFLDNAQNIKIIYTAGYASIPEDLKITCAREVLKEYKLRKKPDIISETAIDGSITRVAIDWLESSKQVLDKYKKRRVF